MLTPVLRSRGTDRAGTCEVWRILRCCLPQSSKVLVTWPGLRGQVSNPKQGTLGCEENLTSKAVASGSRGISSTPLVECICLRPNQLAGVEIKVSEAF